MKSIIFIDTGMIDEFCAYHCYETESEYQLVAVVIHARFAFCMFFTLH